ncbi:pilus assembly protein [Achromobacter sp. Marseille-Q0513]|nr:pilus assembly protein [Achromobacter sp. Marseille-Q0513]
MRAPPRPGRPQHGTALLEFTLAATVLLPAALLAAEAAAWQTVRQAVQLALMEAARAGAVSHAEPARMKAAFVQALRPLHGGDAARQARALREAALLAGAHPWRIEVLRPDAQAFRLHARPGLRIAPAPGLPAIDNDYQDLQHARRPPGQAIDIFQANTLSLRLTYLHKPLSAPLRALLGALARGAQTPPVRQGALFTRAPTDDDPRSYAGQALARGLLPIVVELEMEMHSHPADWSRLRPWPEGMVPGICRKRDCG